MQSEKDMIEAGASPKEAKDAQKLWDLLRPGLKVKLSGRVDTAFGDKNKLGLYRTIQNFMKGVK